MFALIGATVGIAIHLVHTARKVKDELGDFESEQRTTMYGRQMRRNLRALAWIVPLVLVGALLDLLLDTRLFSAT